MVTPSPAAESCLPVALPSVVTRSTQPVLLASREARRERVASALEERRVPLALRTAAALRVAAVSLGCWCDAARDERTHSLSLHLTRASQRAAAMYIWERGCLFLDALSTLYLTKASRVSV